MAYIFDPLRNTFIDDEDTSLGNKLALLDDDLEKAIREIGEKYGPDAIKTLDHIWLLTTLESQMRASWLSTQT
jgi:hypothetical protein